MAGAVGGATYGLAKDVTLHPVRVLNCQGSGSYAGVIAGVDWIAANYEGPAVANLSLGGNVSAAPIRRAQRHRGRRDLRHRRRQRQRRRLQYVPVSRG